MFYVLKLYLHRTKRIYVFKQVTNNEVFLTKRTFKSWESLHLQVFFFQQKFTLANSV